MKLVTNNPINKKGRIKVNPILKSNSDDPFILKKIEKATQILGSLKEPFVL